MKQIYDNKDIGETIDKSFDAGIKEGYRRCKEEMMKEAVEGTVMDFSSNQPRPQVDVLLDAHKYHTGDKVRIIIVKED